MVDKRVSWKENRRAGLDDLLGWNLKSTRKLYQAQNVRQIYAHPNEAHDRGNNLWPIHQLNNVFCTFAHDIRQNCPIPFSKVHTTL